MTTIYLTGWLLTALFYSWMYWTTPESERPEFDLKVWCVVLMSLMVWPAMWCLFVYWAGVDRDE